MKIEIPIDGCTGCMACKSVCEYRAIAAIADDRGFLYPVVDKDKCRACTKCMQVCPLKKKKEEPLSKCPVYAIKSRDAETRFESTSGGAFSEIAKALLKYDYSIIGAIFLDDWKVRHIAVSTQKELIKVQKSKYLQSDFSDVYALIKENLKNNRGTLVCGAPCQIAAVRSVFPDEKSIVTCDFICRGVCSPGVFQSYVHDLEQQYGSKAVKVWMKYKKYGWHSLGCYALFENGAEYYKPGLQDSYAKLMLKYNVTERPSCYECKFKHEFSQADITLGDFWGLDNTEFDDNQGISVCIANTQRGQEIFEMIKDNVLWEKKQLEDVRRKNPCLDNSIVRPEPKTTSQFYKVLKEQGYREAVKIFWNEEERNGQQYT